MDIILISFVIATVFVYTVSSKEEKNNNRVKEKNKGVE